jgi:hypothetical protein
MLQIVALTLRVTGSGLLLAAVSGVPVGAAFGPGRFPRRRAITLVCCTPGWACRPSSVSSCICCCRSGPLGALLASRDDWITDA